MAEFFLMFDKVCCKPVWIYKYKCSIVLLHS